ncbi:hypothetical protein [Streptomyces prasinus]
MTMGDLLMITPGIRAYREYLLQSISHDFRVNRRSPPRTGQVYERIQVAKASTRPVQNRSPGTEPGGFAGVVEGDVGEGGRGAGVEVLVQGELAAAEADEKPEDVQ